MALTVGQVMGKFKIVKELGSGAMGTVYKAIYVPDGRVVAVKIVNFGLSGNESALQRFEREANILKQLKHPNIVRLFASGRYKGTPFIAMEFIEGESLDHVLLRRVRFSWEDVVLIGKQVCLALQHAHEKGIIHRDLKPSNLMMLEDGTTKLTDFGIAKDIDVTALTGANATVGTASYMSPEQCRGESITAKSDIYSLGVVLFELVTGRKPFNAESPIEMFSKHDKEAPPRPNWALKGSSTGEIPVWFETTILQMMEKKPDHRPLNAEIIAMGLEEGLRKYYSGQSAAVDAVQARVGERRIQTNVIDETDREAARTLRGAMQKKKIRKKGTPFYAKPWLLVFAIPPILGIMGLVIYLATRPPSADSLYRQAERKMEKQEYLEALYKLNNAEGPILEFLRRYPEHPNAAKVREWRDFAETTDLFERIKHNAGDPKFKKQYFEWQKVDPNYEKLAFEALKAHEYGDLLRADAHWTSAVIVASKSEDQRVAKRLAELRLKQVFDEWNALKEKDPDAFKDEKTYRTGLLKRKLAEAEKLRDDKRVVDLKKLVDATLELYGGEKNAEVKKLIDEIEATFRAKDNKVDEKGDKKK